MAGSSRSSPDGADTAAALEDTVAGGDGVGEDARSDPGLDQTVAGSAGPDDTRSDPGLNETLAPEEAAGEVALEATVAAGADQATRKVSRSPVGLSRRTTRAGAGSSPHRALGRGDALGRYVVLELLGAGGMGEVYSAYDPELDRKVAVKVIRERVSGELVTAGRQRLLAEAQTLARLSHPNVVAVYDVGTVDTGEVYIAMEFVDGVTLSSWLRDGEPEWGAIVSTMTDAARGLAAAHASGIVHRDFKPDNVLIGSDGRVRVIDFGVARQDERAREIAADVERRELSVTDTGGLVGTPAYMAPEQFEGGEVSPATDQFAFGITLYQALAGRLPFEGQTLLSLADNVTAGRVRGFERDSKAPRWLQEATLRMLERLPSERFPSMNQVIDVLSPQPPRRRWLAAVAAVLVLASAGVAGAMMLGDESEPCAGFDSEVEAVWGPEQRQRVESAIGEDSFLRVAPVLDRYADRWIASKTAACRATRVTLEQPEEVLARRNACLDTGLRDLESRVAILAAGTDRPEEIAIGLPALSRCANLAALGSASPPPEAATDEQIRVIESGLAESHAQDLAGNYQRANELVRQTLSRARELDWKRAVARALIVRAKVEQNLGDPRAARETAFEAVRVAASARDAETEAEAWIQVVAAEGAGMRQPAVALRWAEHAEVALERAGGEHSLRARLAFNRGTARRIQRRDQDALEQFREARALFEHAHGPDHFDVARSRAAAAPILRSMGKLEEAEREFRAALNQLQRLLGDHPMLGPSLNNFALLQKELGRIDEARELFNRALALKERTLGTDHPSVATTLINLALLEQRVGDWNRVESLWKRSHDIRVQALGDDHPKVTWSLYWKTLYHFNRGDDQQALELADRVAVRYRSSTAATPDDLAAIDGVRCELSRRLGKLSAAARYCRSAIETFAKDQSRPERAVFGDLYAGWLAIQRNRLEEAARWEKAATAKLGEISGNTETAEAHLHLLRARLATRRDEAVEARKHAGKALEAYSSLGAGYRYYIEDARVLAATEKAR